MSFDLEYDKALTATLNAKAIYDLLMDDESYENALVLSSLGRISGIEGKCLETWDFEMQIKFF